MSTETTTADRKVNATAAPAAAPEPAMTPAERQAWRDLTRALRRILIGHRDCAATEREAGALGAARATARLVELGIQP